MKQQAKVITPKQLNTLRRPLPESWINAIGIFKGKNINPLRYQKDIRKGWGKRMKKLEKQLRKA